ncbi:hypothetical protein GALMADRAFT_142162 [Galerina marginata CBS 339.88]|uniref:UDP-galactose transporter n=1 Tax=Galerina marginata (strain CBS 339.88) TaxID=685588 RepID=A0A067T189_GALM3|nr:hypothetical protein GALMADRAFT_142162 [Galerina marginata CBS 339.88]
MLQIADGGRLALMDPAQFNTHPLPVAAFNDADAALLPLDAFAVPRRTSCPGLYRLTLYVLLLSPSFFSRPSPLLSFPPIPPSLSHKLTTHAHPQRMAIAPPRVSSAPDVVTNPRVTNTITNNTSSRRPSSDMHHRPPPTVRSAGSLAPSTVSSRAPTPRHSPLLPPASLSATYLDKFDGQLLHHQQQQQQLHILQLQQQQQQPTICGLPLKYVSLVTLAVQNAALSIVMHYSRVSIPPALAYSPASAVLLNELLKGSISFIIALFRSPLLQHPHQANTHYPLTRRKPVSTPLLYVHAFTDLCGEVFSPDCWKLSIPAILYVVQNSLQFVAISNLPVASFQVTYQMKILTTAAFSMVLLRKKLSSVKWLSLFFLAIGVGIVQIQNAAGDSGGGHIVSKAAATAVGSAHEFHVHVMDPLKGFGAVTAACFTSGLAGVYFEMVLKGSKADLWVRNVQLSLFSLIPALLPILYASPPPNSQGFLLDMFRNFGWWAWATVAIQVFGGLVTAVVIKYSDNILKGFATSLSIVLSFLASVALFDFHITPSFVIGASTVLGATWMYNQPASSPSSALPTSTTPVPASSASSGGSSPIIGIASSKEKQFAIVLNDASPPSSGKSSPSSSPYYPGTPINAGSDGSGSVLGLGVGSFMRRKSGGFGGAGSSRNSSTTSLSALVGAAAGGAVGGAGSGTTGGIGSGSGGGRGELGLAESGELVPYPQRPSVDGGAGGEALYITPFSSRPPSRMPSRAPSPSPRGLGSVRMAGERSATS